MKLVNSLLIVSFLILMSACNGNQAGSGDNADSSSADATSGQVQDVELTGTDNMTYDKSEIKVKAGGKIRLTFKHSGTIPKELMGHNFVLLKKGVEVGTFGPAASQAAPPDYEISPELLKDVIAHTKMIGGGESVTIEFDTPGKGTYDYICTFPGHFGVMKGKFIVE